MNRILSHTFADDGSGVWEMVCNEGEEVENRCRITFPAHMMKTLVEKRADPTAVARSVHSYWDHDGNPQMKLSVDSKGTDLSPQDVSGFFADIEVIE
jgi:hypothetical protein